MNPYYFSEVANGSSCSPVPLALGLSCIGDVVFCPVINTRGFC